MSRRYDPGELVLRRARKWWRCEGKGYKAEHAADCLEWIEPGEDYIEMMPGGVSYMDSHRYTVACARLHWNWPTNRAIPNAGKVQR